MCFDLEKPEAAGWAHSSLSCLQVPFSHHGVLADREKPTVLNMALTEVRVQMVVQQGLSIQINAAQDLMVITLISISGSICCSDLHWGAALTVSSSGWVCRCH